MPDDEAGGDDEGDWEAAGTLRVGQAPTLAGLAPFTQEAGPSEAAEPDEGETTLGFCPALSAADAVGLVPGVMERPTAGYWRLMCKRHAINRDGEDREGGWSQAAAGWRVRVRLRPPTVRGLWVWPTTHDAEPGSIEVYVAEVERLLSAGLGCRPRKAREGERRGFTWRKKPWTVTFTARSESVTLELEPEWDG